MKRHLSTLIKVLVTVLGLAYALAQIDFEQAVETFRRLQWQPLLLVLVLINVSLVVRALRWWLLLRGLGARVKIGRLIALYFSGNFFNIFLPSGFGGDVVRVVEVSRQVPYSTAAGTVLVDRLTGMMTLFIIALFTLPFRPESFPSGQAQAVAALSVVGLVGCILLLTGLLESIANRILPSRISPLRIKSFAQMMAAIRNCRRDAVLGAMGVSMIFNAILILWWYVAGQALGYSDVSLAYYALVVPILSVALLVPSVGGLGLPEALAPGLFAAAGLTDTDAVALSLLIFTLTRISGLFGAPVYIVSALRTSRQGEQTEREPVTEADQ